jgi:hypothetical protein
MDGEVKIVLNNATIKNPNGPAIACTMAEDLVIEAVGENYLEDAAKYADKYDEDVNGVIYSKADLALIGDGLLKIVSNYQDGIVSKDDLAFRSGAYNIVSKDDAVRGKDSIYIGGGKITIDAGADGLKSTNDSDEKKGFILIENSEITIAAGDDGIHAEKQLQINSGTINISKAYEGLESPVITINDGYIAVKTSDDGLNAGAGSSTSNSPRPGGMMDADKNCILTINGGEVYVNASGDGIDSNGYVFINGGKIIVDGPTSDGNGALDSGIGFKVTGGEVIAVGSSGMAEDLGKDSSIYNVSIYLNTTAKAGTKIEIKSYKDGTLIEHTSAKQFSHIAVASSSFEQGEEYVLYLNGKKTATFTINDIVTIVGEKFNHKNFRK